ncbi:MAG: methionyl-tRNA formyltransferase [Myxococcota bacterium]
MPSLRVLFFGSPAFAVPSLRALHAAGHQVVGAVCQPDAPKGRGYKLEPPAVKVAAEELGIPVHQPERVKGEKGKPFLELARSLKPDIAVVAAYGKILPQDLLDVPRAGCVNLHASILPRFRGASPIQHAILEGDAETGVCLMRMVLELDAGDVYACARTRITDEDTAEALSARLADLAAELCVKHLPDVVSGALKPEPQDPTKVTYAPMLDKEMGRILWSGDAAREARRVRAMTPWPGTWTLFRGETLKIHRAQVVTVEGEPGVPGTVIAMGPDFLDVACAQDALRLLEVQPPGKRRMGTGDFMRGARLRVGDSFQER